MVSRQVHRLSRWEKEISSSMEHLSLKHGVQSASDVVKRESDVTSVKGTFLNKGKSVCLAAVVKGVRKTSLLITEEPQ